MVQSLKPNRYDWLALFIPLGVGLVLGVVTWESDPVRGSWGQFFDWLFFLLAGTLAHRLSWFLWHERRPRPFTHQVRTQIPYLATGILFTYAAILAQVRPQTPGLFGLILAQVLVISILVHVLMLTTGVLESFAQLREQRQQAQSQLWVETGGKQVAIPLADLLAILVQDHYCTLYYQTQGTTAELMLYGRLIDYEAQAKGWLVRVSRSALVSLGAIESIGGGRNQELKVQGVKESFRVSRSRKAELEALLDRQGATKTG